MNGAKDKVFKSWAGINEVALIKEVATKGEHIELCIEFWARKRKMAIKDYRLFFHDVVQNYVQRLLTERLVCKAENVLRNVQRDVRCCYYQFACECDDEELREIVLDHIRRKDGFDDMQELHFNWELLQQLKEHPEIFSKCKSHMSERRIDLEAMLAMDINFRKRLLVELYFASRNVAILPQLNKHSVWNYLVETQNDEELVRWLNADSTNATTLLEQQYALWLPLELEMYEFALKTLRDVSELLRDCFARVGHFFADERTDVVKLLRRICITSSFEVNRELLEKLPLARFLVETKQYMLLLRPFVSVRELEELEELFLDHRKLIELIVTLKNFDINTREGFEKIFYATKVFLESCEEKRAEELAQISTVEEPLISFYEFFCYEPTLASLNCFLRSSALQRIPYLAALTERLETHISQTGGSGTAHRTASTQQLQHKQLPTAYELLRKFKNIDFKHINRSSANEIASFSNERLCQRFARRYQLNFLHYLKQQRSAYAVYFLITSQLQGYAQLARSQIFSACETVTELALRHADSTELIAHCVAFMEILGFDTQSLRTLLKLAKRTTSLDCITNYGRMFSEIETQLLLELSSDENDFPLDTYQALTRLVVCNKSEHQWPTVILEHYANRNDWWRLLLLAQYFDVPLNCLRELISSFGIRQIGEHLQRALSYDAPALKANDAASNGSSKRHQSAHSLRHRKSNVDGLPAVAVTTSIETMTSSMSSCNDTNSTNLCPKTLDHMQKLRFLASVDQSLSGMHDSNSIKLDLFALILLSSSTVNEDVIGCCMKFIESMQSLPQQNSTSWNLVQNAVKYRLPVLAILASTINQNNSSWHWLVWLSVAIGQWNELLHYMASQGKEQRKDLAWYIIQLALRHGYLITLYRSICIFYGSEYPFSHFCRFLCLTRTGRFSEEKAIHELSMFLLAWSNDEICMPFEMGQTAIRRDMVLQRTMQLLLLHLQYNFDSIIEQQRFLACICRSGMTDLCGGQIDFCLLNEVFSILGTQTEKFILNFENLLQQHESHAEYKRLLASFLDAHAYDAAIRLANLLQLPICDIVYSKWIATLNALNSINDNAVPDDFIDFPAYENEVLEHALPPEVLVNFLLHAASLITDESSMVAARRKYILLQHALNVIKKHLLFPNECFDRDQIEYNMIICYLQLDENAIANLNIYHSEYYEQIMLQERCVLYKSFLELKQLAGIEDLNGWSLKAPLTDNMQVRFERLLHRLLDESDIVEALRLQELFEYRPLDLRFIVFCMALAEGVTTIFSMSSEERQLLQDVEKSAFSKFNKRTLDSIRSSSMGGRGAANSSSPMRDEFSDSSSTLEFEEIPSKEKRETLETIQGIASKLEHGIELGKRVFMAYRAAMYLDKEYLDVLRTKDANILLRSVAEESCLHRLLVVSDILNSTHKTEDEIADLLAYELTTAIIRPRFYIFTSGQKLKNSLKNADLWGYNIDRDLHLFLELTPNTTKLGNCMLKYCDALKSYRKYQDNKPYDSTPTFDKLAEIIRIYGLPTTSASANVAPRYIPTSAPSMTFTSSTTTTTTTSMMMMMTTTANESIGATGDATSESPNINSNNNSPPTPQVLSHKKQNLIYVELLIKAHQCFVHECSMEGIANVLYRAKSLNTILTYAKSWSLIVRMLIGIGRYREMYYCFDALIKNEQFESLLGQFDEDKTIGLRQAILAYLREYAHENSRDLLKLAALHFLMYKDLAETWEQDAQIILSKVLNVASFANNNTNSSDNGGHFIGGNSELTCTTRLRFTPEVLGQLEQALENYTHATENYLLDNKLLLAQKCVSMCEVIAMQIDLLSKIASNATLNVETNSGTVGSNQTSYHISCVCVLNVQTRQEFRELVNTELSVPQALILSRGYGYDISWAEALLSQYILLMRKKYLQDYLALMPINDGIIENVIKGFQRYVQNHKTLPQMEEHLSHLVTQVRSITLKYKLASLLSMKALVMSLINDQTLHYLKDTNYARIENHNLPDV